MGSVYHHNILNIAATGFSDGENGLFAKRDPNIMTPIAVSIEADQFVEFDPGTEKSHRAKGKSKGDYYLVDTFTWKEGVDESPLCKRGWVTQERALSVRTLRFGKQELYWECMQEDANEVFPIGLLKGTIIQNPKVFLSSQENDKKKRKERLLPLREHIEHSIRCNREFEEEMKVIKASFLSVYNESSDEDELMMR
jgi:hypothetical protein